MLNTQGIWQISVAIVAGLLVGEAWGGDLPTGNYSPSLVDSEEPLQPLPTTLNLNPQKVALGGRLFSDLRLSHNNTISCQSCHNLEGGGADNLQHSVGINGQEGDINAPTVFNSGFNFRQFWDGRAESLEQQIDGPISNPKEMGSSWDEVIGKLQKVPDYVQAFASIYPTGLTPENIKNAIATFERSLITPAPFDRFLNGEQGAISVQARNGYHLFKSYGCVACHQGVNVGGNMFQTFDLFKVYFKTKKEIKKTDFGRYNVTGREVDRYRFKVPGLRNVVLTAPYLHDGSIDTLSETVQIMGRYQLGIELPTEDIDDIVSFLESLTGKQRGQAL